MSEHTSDLVVADTRASAMVRAEDPGVDNSTAGLVRLAMERGLDVAMIGELLRLKREEEAEQARRAYTSAKAAFAASAPTILKDHQVDYPLKEGGRVKYKHATIGNVIETSGPVLASHGFGWEWMTSQDKGQITVTCRLTHELGHSESATLTAAPDTSGKKNAIQQVASAATYLQRYTFLLVTGLATRDQRDDDSRSSYQEPAGRPEPPAPAVNSDMIPRAQRAVQAYAAHLGGDARRIMEEFLGLPGEEWTGSEVDRLLESFKLTRDHADPADKRRALLAEMGVG